MYARLSDAIPIFLIGTMLAALLFLYLPMDGLWAGDQGAKYVQIESLIRHRFASATLLYPGATLDPAGEFSPVPALFTVPRSGSAVSIYSYPYAFLCALFFSITGVFGLYLPSVGAALGLLFLCIRLGQLMDIRSPRILSWIIGIGTPVLFYSLSFWEHELAALMAAGSLVLGVQALRRQGAFWAFGAGIVAALAFLIRPETLHLGLALCAGLGAAAPPRRWKLVAAAASGWALGLLPGTLLNMTIYGHPLGGVVTLNFGEQTFLSIQLLAKKVLASRSDTMMALAFDRDSSWLFFGTLIILACLINFTAGWRRAAICIALAATVLGLWFPERGMFLKTGLIASCPVVLLALSPHSGSSPIRETLRFIRWFCGIYFLLVILTAPNDGGAQWGPRYLLPAVAPCVALAWYQAERLFLNTRQWERYAVTALIGVLLLLSGALQFHSLSVLEYSLSRGRSIQEATRKVGHDVVLTDVWWGPQILARLYFERRIFLLHQPQKLGPFIAKLEADDSHSFVFVATRGWSRDLRRLRDAGATCQPAAEFAGPLLVLDCRTSASSPPAAALAGTSR
ncbi:MAG: hypothetical protein GY835_03295 [bacterium]|nr:hypothetical protein [bacterium]